MDAVASIPLESSRSFAGLIALGGLLCCVVAGWLFASTASFTRKAVRVQGHEIDMFKARGDSRGISYSQRIRFRSAHGDILVVGRRLTTFRFFWPREGSPLEVLYEAGNPHHARLNGFPDLWLLPFLLLGFGGLLLAAAGVKWMPDRPSIPPARLNLQDFIPSHR